MNDRAIVYRRKYNIPAEWGTAVNVQAMVFGNTGDNSGSGVAFTRNPANGENEFYGEFLINAQGEDVVAGVRTPEPVAELKKQLPKAYARAAEGSARSSRSTSRTCRTSSSPSRKASSSCSRPATASAPPLAALKFAMDMVKEKLIDWKTADPAQPGRPARPAARAGLRRRRGQEGQGHRHRPAGRSGCRLRQDLPQRRPRRRRRGEGRKGPARPRRNLARKTCAA